MFKSNKSFELGLFLVTIISVGNQKARYIFLSYLSRRWQDSIVFYSGDSRKEPLEGACEFSNLLDVERFSLFIIIGPWGLRSGAGSFPFDILLASKSVFCSQRSLHWAAEESLILGLSSVTELEELVRHLARDQFSIKDDFGNQDFSTLFHSFWHGQGEHLIDGVTLVGKISESVVPVH